MALSLVNNVTSMAAQNSLNKTNSALGKSLERLSSGLKVNRGADGPAALVISEQQRAQISGLRAAMDNTNKAISVVQTGEGALNEINNLLNKVRSLAVDSANTGVNDAGAQAANQAEMSNILTTIDRIANTTQFGSKKLLDGSAGMSGSSTSATVGFTKATGETVAGSYAVAITTAAAKATTDSGAVQAGALATDENLSINGTQIKLTAGMNKAQVISKINEFKDQTGVIADAGGAGTATRLISKEYGAGAKIQVVSDVASAVTSSGFGTTATNVTGTNMAATITGATSVSISGDSITATAGAAKGLSVKVAAADAISTSTTGATVSVQSNALTFQVGANAGQTVQIALDKMTTNTLGVGASTAYSSLSGIDTSNSSEALKVIDAAINDVTSLRGRLGAFQQNTLESNSNNLKTTLENTTAAESVIRDTDFASEIANFTKMQTQMQAGSTVLGNANQLTQLVAGLLRG
jgi:flagellin